MPAASSSSGLGKFFHHREPTPLDFHIVRPNRDTLYSLSVFDLDAGPVTITLPDAGERFLTMQVIDEDHYTPEVVYGAGTHTFTREQIGTRYVSLGVRILVDRPDPEDVKQVHALQDAITVDAAGRSRTLRGAELGRDKPEEGARRTSGAWPRRCPIRSARSAARGQVDPVRHLIGTAFAFGGNPEKDALYLNVTPAKNDGSTIYSLRVEDVPVDAFWSISVYNAQGRFQKNPFDAYALNNKTAKMNADRSVTVQFGGCDGNIPNCLPIMSGWNYMVRLYRPRAEILDGTWKLPEAQPVN